METILQGSAFAGRITLELEYLRTTLPAKASQNVILFILSILMYEVYEDEDGSCIQLS